MHRKDIVKEVCRRLKDRWWDAHFPPAPVGSASIVLSGEPFLMVFLQTTSETLLRGGQFDGLYVIEQQGEDTEGTEHRSFGFFEKRRVMEAIRVAAERQADLRRASELLRNRFGREPTHDELCNAMGLNPTMFD